MKLVQINRGDVLGSRFNGYGLRELLAEQGIDSTHLVWDKTVDDPAVKSMLPFPGSRLLVRTAGRIERRLSTHSLLQLQSFGLPLEGDFRAADVVHYHIVHDGFFSILAMPFLSRLKPSVWTWHDPWIMTGHCIYPKECDRWKIGCGQCPDLDRFFTMERDHTRWNFRQKQRIVRHSDFDVVLASQWMMDMARRSPIGRNARLHHIPFGLDLDHYKPREPQAARERFGVFKDHVVICVRAFATSPYKGFDEFVKALERLQTKKKVCVLSFQETGVMNHLIGKHQIIELGWVKDDATMLDAYAAADLFAMPSTAEAFGLMAIEAMACGKPVVVFDGTSLPEVAFAPEAGLAVPMGDVDALAAAMARLIDDPVERATRGRRSRELAERHYDARLQAERLAKLYRSVAHKRRSKTVVATGQAA